MSFSTDKYQAMRKIYLKKIEQEVPQSGALEYIEGFMAFTQAQNVSKARRSMRKAKKMATAANDSGILDHIAAAEHILSASPGNLMNMLFGRGGLGGKGGKGKKNEFGGLLEEFLEEMGGFEDGDLF